MIKLIPLLTKLGVTLRMAKNKNKKINNILGSDAAAEFIMIIVDIGGSYE